MADLLPRVVCPACRAAATRLCGRLVCDCCDWSGPRLGQPGAADLRPPAPRRPPEDTKAAHVRRAAVRKARAVEWLRAHPWSTPVEAAPHLGCSAETVRSIWMRSGTARRIRRGQLFEYALQQEAEAC